MKRIKIPNNQKGYFFPSLPSAAHSFVIANQWISSSCPILVVVGSSISTIETLAEDIISILKQNFREQQDYALHLLEEETNESHPDAFERKCSKLSLLSALIDIQNETPARTVIASTPDGILSPCPIITEKKKKQLTLSKGMMINFESFQEKLSSEFDYSSEILCEEPGQFAVRGGLIDVYPVNSDFPYRIDFWGDEIDEIRIFDPSSQRTTKSLNSISLHANSTQDEDGVEGGFFSYLNCRTTWAFIEPERLTADYPLAFHKSEKVARACMDLAWDSDAGKNCYMGLSEIDAGEGCFELSTRNDLCVEASSQSLSTNMGSLKLDNESRYKIKYLFELLEKQDSGHQIIIATGANAEKKRISELIKEESSLKRLSPKYLDVGLRDGFSINGKYTKEYLSNLDFNHQKGVCLATAREILGRERSRRPIRTSKARANRKKVDQALDFSELVKGDFLVHHQHGICRFDNLGKVDLQGNYEEVITLEFDDGLMLHLPFQESHLLSRYIGLQKAKPKLAKLGGKAWAKTKKAAEIAAIDLAADLLRLQASRESKHGFAFSPDDTWQKEFEDSFPYVETPDQQKAIDQVKLDMEDEKPMDRLVCGDVGFGKTEIALRASFKAFMDGKQVALLAPTTILCQQHYNHFKDRMSDFPITIEMLSRFRTYGEQRKILNGLSAGTVDLVVGTHKLLGPNISFKDLGLLIIDEEQRFGVQHKEAIKRIRQDVDILTLSATPIPRTLYFAMVGARDLSSIETAPTNRRPIRTEVMKHSSAVLERAIQTEVRRGGQIFYLHNRVKTIHSVARKLNDQFPKLQIAVGHGQMKEDDLERVMTDFVAGKYDILVCTTIIESGLDIPNCNTIIIEGADKFGLSQLYQLRGRVGRFDKQAYAYLLLNQNLTVSDQARKRLSAIKKVNHFGAGLQIALRDLELRGAGNLLGSEQSGHVAGVGFELYCRLLRESVSRLKGEEISLRPTAVVRLDFLISGPTDDDRSNSESLASYLPEKYVREPRIRIECYRRLARFNTIEEIDDFECELVDRFGELPDEGLALLEEARIRCLAEEACFDLVETKHSEIWCRLVIKNRDGTRKFHRSMGKIPKISSKEPLLKLKEIIRFLKIVIHGNIDD